MGGETVDIAAKFVCLKCLKPLVIGSNVPILIQDEYRIETETYGVFPI